VADRSDNPGNGQGSQAAANGEASRLDRELIELLQELRTILPGVQVLFAFLLTVPFSQRFAQTSDLERAVFFTAFLATALSAVLLMVPGVWHRLRFRERDKEDLLAVSNNLTVAATVALAVAITAVVFLIGEVLYGAEVGVICAAATVVVISVFWYLSPLWPWLQRRLSGRGDA
jgi:hypothetical protein